MFTLETKASAKLGGRRLEFCMTTLSGEIQAIQRLTVIRYEAYSETPFKSAKKANTISNKTK